jgi:hypothetical protein
MVDLLKQKLWLWIEEQRQRRMLRGLGTFTKWELNASSRYESRRQNDVIAPPASQRVRIYEQFHARSFITNGKQFAAPPSRMHVIDHIRDRARELAALQAARHSMWLQAMGIPQ